MARVLWPASYQDMGRSPLRHGQLQRQGLRQGVRLPRGLGPVVCWYHRETPTRKYGRPYLRLSDWQAVPQLQIWRQVGVRVV